MELADQLESKGIQKAHIYIVAGTSMTGLALGAKLLGLDWKVTGIYSGDRPNIEEAIQTYADHTKKILGLPTSLNSEDVDLYLDYVAPGYAIPSNIGIEAIKLVGSLEGILLDPTYTGKAFAAVIEDIRKGKLKPGETVIFVHTGGLPALFIQDYTQELIT